MPNTCVRAMRCASCCSTSRTWIVCWAKTSARRRRNRSMIASNGHAPKAFRRNAQPHIYVCSKGFRGAAPDKQRAVFRGGGNCPKSKVGTSLPCLPELSRIRDNDSYTESWIIPKPYFSACFHADFVQKIRDNFSSLLSWFQYFFIRSF